MAICSEQAARPACDDTQFWRPRPTRPNRGCRAIACGIRNIHGRYPGSDLPPSASLPGPRQSSPDCPVASIFGSPDQAFPYRPGHVCETGSAAGNYSGFSHTGLPGTQVNEKRTEMNTEVDLLRNTRAGAAVVSPRFDVEVNRPMGFPGLISAGLLHSGREKPRLASAHCHCHGRIRN